MTASSFLEKLDMMAYVGDVHGVEWNLKELENNSLTGEEAKELMAASMRGCHPYQTGIHAALQKACASSVPIQENVTQRIRRLSPMQRRVLRVLTEQRLAAAPFLIQSAQTEPAPRRSYFGGFPHAMPEEEWPEYQNVPMTFVCHIWLADAPFEHPAVRGIAALSLFMHTEEIPGPTLNDGWHIRSYSLSECELLQIRHPPTADDVLPGCWAVDWQPQSSELPGNLEIDKHVKDLEDLKAEHAAWLDQQSVMGDDDIEGGDDDFFKYLCPHQAAASCKLFGYPYSLQDGVAADDNFFLVLQLVPMDRIGLSFFEGGFAYFGVQTESDGSRQWVCNFEYY